MRITQHKTKKDSSGSGLTEDTTGITMSSSPPKTITVAGAVVKGHSDFPPEAVRGFHKEKPPMPQSNVKPIMHIQQPRK